MDFKRFLSLKNLRCFSFLFFFLGKVWGSIFEKIYIMIHFMDVFIIKLRGVGARAFFQANQHG